MELNFDNLNSLKDPKEKVDFLSSFLSDDLLFKFNPDRYEFYLKFISGLTDPENLKKFYYKKNKINNNSLKEKALIDEIVKLLRSLGTKDKEKLIKNIEDTFKIDDVVDIGITKKISDIIKKGGNYDKTKLPTYDEPIKNLNKILESGDKNKISKELRTNPLIIDNKLDVTLNDKLIFIGITFVLRIISLFIIEWSLNANVVNNFFYALVGYCCFYIILFMFLVFLVNVIFYYPVIELYTDYSIVDFPNMLYYLYVYNDGYYRILIHLGIFSLLLLLPFILDFNTIEQDIKYDYKKKQEVLTSITNFSFIIWVLTSLIAIKF